MQAFNHSLDIMHFYDDLCVLSWKRLYCLVNIIDFIGTRFTSFQNLSHAVHMLLKSLAQLNVSLQEAGTQVWSGVSKWRCWDIFHKVA